jgi:hypothetical protein
MVKKLIVSLPIHCTMETLTPLLMILTLKAPDPHSAAYISIFLLPSRPASGQNLPTFFFGAHYRIKIKKNIKKL